MCRNFEAAHKKLTMNSDSLSVTIIKYFAGRCILSKFEQLGGIEVAVQPLNTLQRFWFVHLHDYRRPLYLGLTRIECHNC
jgi:hypothetical protein